MVVQDVQEYSLTLYLITHTPPVLVNRYGFANDESNQSCMFILQYLIPSIFILVWRLVALKYAGKLVKEHHPDDDDFGRLATFWFSIFMMLLHATGMLFIMKHSKMNSRLL